MRSLGVTPGGAVGDLLAEVVALAEHLADDVDDVLGVESSLAKMRVFGTSVRPGKISVKSLSLEGCEDGADLVRATTARSSWLGS